MKSTRLLYIQKVASELHAQSEIPLDRPSALIKMLVTAAADQHKLYSNSTDRVILSLANYYRNRIYAYIPMQREVAELIRTNETIRLSSVQLFNDMNATRLNLQVVIRSMLLMISNVLLAIATAEEERKNFERTV